MLILLLVKIVYIFLFNLYIYILPFLNICFHMFHFSVFYKISNSTKAKDKSHHLLHIAADVEENHSVGMELGEHRVLTQPCLHILHGIIYIYILDAVCVCVSESAVLVLPILAGPTFQNSIPPKNILPPLTSQTPEETKTQLPPHGSFLSSLNNGSSRPVLEMKARH